MLGCSLLIFGIVSSRSRFARPWRRCWRHRWALLSIFFRGGNSQPYGRSQYNSFVYALEYDVYFMHLRYFAADVQILLFCDMFAMQFLQISYEWSRES